MTTNSEDSAHPESLGALCTFLENDFVRLCLNSTFLFYVTLLRAGGSIYFIDQSGFTAIGIAFNAFLVMVHSVVLMASRRFNKQVKFFHTFVLCVCYSLLAGVLWNVRRSCSNSGESRKR
ncbi:hypothetical protein L596_009787 [Steinernema carpocapsae]|uniref:Uncharacterized protein n=1 Tax=Steinernema carpocapsae TaxID=34508 RepID=A0A4U5PGK7_STECR|nr:hypothetical protein L596_009787 [Steinernema carpocapsae]